VFEREVARRIVDGGVEQQGRALAVDREVRPLGFVAATAGEEPVVPVEHPRLELGPALGAVVLDVWPGDVGHPRLAEGALAAEHASEHVNVGAEF
jgi:hypothetical protein